MQEKTIELTVNVPTALLVQALVDNIMNGNPLPSDRDNSIPKIGTHWKAQGGIYAGVMSGLDGAPDYHLIVGPAFEYATWDEQKLAVFRLSADGFNDFTLPDRQEQALQFANVPELFESEWYWSGTQHASNSDYAWCQGFGDGDQHCRNKDGKLRARAVRRLIIQ